MTSSASPFRRPLPPRPHAPNPDVLLRPGQGAWDQARQAWNLSADQQPAAIGLPRTPEDVASLVRFARERGLRVAPQTTGHGAECLGSLHESLLLRTSRMREVKVSAGARSVTAGAGALWMDVTGLAGRHRLAALAGSAPDVGVAGYTLGGGIGWLARRYGLAAGSVRRAQVVTADGRLLGVDRAREPELFWALRGGGGSYAIVTELELELYPVTQVYAGALIWPLERAFQILHCWADWLAQVPDEVTSIGRLLRIPPMPGLPPGLSGRQLVALEAAFIGTREGGERLLAPLRALGPEIDTFAMMSPQALGQLHMDPPAPVPAAGDGMLLRALPPEAIEDLLDVAGGAADSPLLSVDLRHLGGVLGRERLNGGAVSKIDGEFAVFAVGIAPERGARDRVRDHVEAIRNALGRWGARRSFLNLSERPRPGDELFGEDVHQRLRAVKAAYDPDDFIQSNHPVRPAETGPLPSGRNAGLRSLPAIDQRRIA